MPVYAWISYTCSKSFSVTWRRNKLWTLCILNDKMWPSRSDFCHYYFFFKLVSARRLSHFCFSFILVCVSRYLSFTERNALLAPQNSPAQKFVRVSRGFVARLASLCIRSQFRESASTLVSSISLPFSLSPSSRSQPPSRSPHPCWRFSLFVFFSRHVQILQFRGYHTLANLTQFIFSRYIVPALSIYSWVTRAIFLLVTFRTGQKRENLYILMNIHSKLKIEKTNCQHPIYVQQWSLWHRYPGQ